MRKLDSVDIVLAFVLALAVYSCTTNEAKAESDFSILLPLGSYHFDDKTRAKANQVNLGIGIRYNLSENFYGQMTYIDKNTAKGETFSASLGTQFTVFKQNKNSLKLGLELSKLKYDNPSKNKTFIGTVPSITVSYGKSSLSGQVNIFPAGKRSILLFSLVTNNDILF